MVQALVLTAAVLAASPALGAYVYRDMPEDWNDLIVRAPHWGRLSSRMIKVPVPAKSDVAKPVNKPNAAQPSATPAIKVNSAQSSTPTSKANAAQSSTPASKAIASHSGTPTSKANTAHSSTPASKGIASHSGTPTSKANTAHSSTPASKVLASHSSASPSQTGSATSHKAVGNKNLDGPDGRKDRRPGDERNRNHRFESGPNRDRLEEERNRKDRRPGNDRNRFNDRLPNERRPEDRNRLNDRPRPMDPRLPNEHRPVGQTPPELPKGPVLPKFPIEPPKLPISNKIPIHKTQTNSAPPAPNRLQEEQSLVDQLFKLEGRDESYPRSFDDEIYELLMRRSYYEDLEDLE